MRRSLSYLFLEKIDALRGRFAEVREFDPKLLHTENRKDIDLRIEFLREVLEYGKQPKDTEYYRFMAGLDAKEKAGQFLQLYEDIKTHGIRKPIVAGKYDQNMVRLRSGKIMQNNTGYQLIDGAHRLAAALYLNFKTIPVKIYKPFLEEIPDYG